MKFKQKASLAEGPIAPRLVRLTIPMIFGLIGMVAFNLVDAFYVGQLGTEELAALSFTFPVVMVLGAIGMGLGMGASAVISRAIGERDKEKVQRLTTDSLVLAVIFASVFIAVGLFSMDPLFRILGAEGNVLVYVKEYMYLWYVGVIFLIVPFVGNNAIRANGDTRTPAAIMLAMVGLNIILDPILIFGWGPIPAMRLEGAALATVIARALSLVLGMYFLRYRDDLLSVKIPPFTKILDSWRKLLRVGLPAAATNLVVPLTTAVITNLVSSYGEAAVGALGVASRIDLLAISVVVALSSVLGPFVGQNLGAGKLERVKTGISLSQRFALLWGLIVFAIVAATASLFAPLFNDDPDVISALILYLAIAPFSYAPRGIYALNNTTLNVMDKPMLASLITLIQMFIVYIPLAYGFSWLWGLQGVFIALASAYLFGGTASSVLVWRHIRHLESIAPEVKSIPEPSPEPA